jgi:hypothetical protein
MTDEALLIGIQRTFQFLAKQIGETNDRVQGSPKLVAHAGKKFALQPVGTLHFTVPDLKLLIGRAQFRRELPVHRVDLLFRLFSTRDVAHNGDDARTLRRANGAQANFDRKLTAVFTLGEELKAYAHGTRHWMLGIVIAVLAMPMFHGFRHDQFYKLAEQFFAPVAEHFLGGGIQENDCAITLHLENAVRGRFEKIAETPVRLDMNLRFFGYRIRAGFPIFQRPPPR